MPRSIHSPAYHRLCTFLIQSRESEGLTQDELADRLGRPQSFVSKYERGQRRLDVVELIEIAEALRIDPHKALDAVLNARS
jgi:transcriptional regulator with XRE-family HTH domain